MASMVIRLLAFLVVAYLGLCATLFTFQRSLLYSPQPMSAGGIGITVVLPTIGDRVLVTVRPRAGATALLYFGGNSEDVSLSLPNLSAAFPDHAIYLLHYRGYGGSTGKPSEAAFFADALALYDMVRASHSLVEIVGSSLGTGVAVYVASLRPVTRLVLVTPYDSIEELYAHKLSFIPVRWLIRDKFESWKYAPQVTAPTLILVAGTDEMIPRERSERLYAYFRSGIASMRFVPGASHNSIYESAQYIPLLKGSL